jgi:hypothetical protein
MENVGPSRQERLQEKGIAPFLNNLSLDHRLPGQIRQVPHAIHAGAVSDSK